MTKALLKVICIILLGLPLSVTAQTRMIVYDGFSGIYNTVSKNDTVLIATIVPDSPADIAGLQYRDQILSINDSVVSGRGLSSREVKALLHGSSSDSIHLKIKRIGRDSILSFSFPRDPYLYQIESYDYSYLVDSLGQWDINDILDESFDSLFTNPLTAKIMVYSVEEGSSAARVGIRVGDQVISLAEEMDLKGYYNLNHSPLSEMTLDTAFTILRGDSVLYFTPDSSLEQSLKGIRSQFDKDFSSNCIWIKIHTENRLSDNRTYLLIFLKWRVWIH